MVVGAMLGVGRDDGVSLGALFLDKETEVVWRVVLVRDVGFGNS